MKLLIVAGGGGHFAPALAVIEKLPKDWDLLVVGRKYVFEGDQSLSLEYQTATKLNIPFQPLTTGRLQRKFTRYTINSLLKIPIGLTQATSIVSKFKPDVVLSFGGYVSVPIVAAAAFLKIPIVVHEQTLGAGASNKFASKFARKICVSWKESEKFFPKEKIVLTGNPIRSVITRRDPSAGSGQAAQSQEIVALLSVARNDKIIYITGGSAGAHAINLLIEGCLENLLKKYIVIHQTGDAREFGDYERLTKLRESLNPQLQKRYEIRKFIEPGLMLEFLEKANLVVSRSGINTVTELLYFGKPALLIPLPYGQKNEQSQNADFIKKIGLAEIEEQESLTSEKLYLKITQMFGNIDKYINHAAEGKKLIDKNAAKNIIEVLYDAINKPER